MRCVVSCCSTSFPWLVFFFGALLWGSMIHKHTGRWMWHPSTVQPIPALKNKPQPPQHCVTYPSTKCNYPNYPHAVLPTPATQCNLSQLPTCHVTYPSHPTAVSFQCGDWSWIQAGLQHLHCFVVGGCVDGALCVDHPCQLVCVTHVVCL